ncbi:ribonuclease Z [Ligilactobacillus sp. Marseille-Q7487]|uniref:ribonuclease Z n=1 Tax=Ligilactobacillus sp. Marseille-Q7487 TaxID=3022128 RepID=UPI0015B63635|nr:ribonuclease Z [Ligilactobacillus sp. Marseille-Q7487]
MELEFLGTGAGSPAKFRNVTSLALKLLDEINEIWLFDCGEGTQHQILHTTIRPRKVDRIFITHLHGDHIFGLPGFLSSRSFQGAQKADVLKIYGPKGIKQYLETSLKFSQTKLTYPIEYVELTPNFAGTLFDEFRFKVTCMSLDHRISCFGYRIEEKDYPGELLIDKLKEENVAPGPIYGRLKAGETVTLEDGRVLDGKNYLGQTKKGRTITILGDTRQVSSVAQLAKNADVLVHESTFGKGEAKIAKNYYHATCQQAASVAKEAQVKQLLLTHISARYLGAAVLELQNDAQQIFNNTKVVKDFDIIKVPFPK